MDAATKMMMARANPGMAAQAYAGVEYLPVNVYYPHDSTAEKEGTLNVKIGNAWAPRKCAVRGNFLFIFSPSRENEKEALLEQENMESVSLQESTTGKKKPPNKKEQKTTTNDTTVIPLEYAVVQRGHGSAGVGQFTFIVYHADDSSGSYHFSQFLSCSTEEDRDEWMHALGSCSTRELLADREESAASVMHAAEEMESVHVQLAAEQEQKKRIVEMLEAQAELGRALTEERGMLTQHLMNIGENVNPPPVDLMTRLSIPTSGTMMGATPSTSSTSSTTAFNGVPPIRGSSAGFAFNPSGPLLVQPSSASFPVPASMLGAGSQPALSQEMVPQTNPIPLNIESLSVQPEQTMHIVPKPLPLSQIPYPPQQQQVSMTHGNQVPLYGGLAPPSAGMNGNRGNGSVGGSMNGTTPLHPPPPAAAQQQWYSTPIAQSPPARVLERDHAQESPPPPLPLPEAPGSLNFIVYDSSIHDENIIGEIILNNRCTLTDIRVQVIKELEVQRGHFLMECNGVMLDSGNESAYAIHAGCRPDNILVLKFIREEE